MEDYISFLNRVDIDTLMLIVGDDSELIINDGVIQDIVRKEN